MLIQPKYRYLKQTILLTCSIFLLNFIAWGQNEKYMTPTNSELEVYRDLILSIDDSSFVISPFIEDSISSSLIDIPKMVNNYGFTKSQFKNATTDTLFIRKNKFFEVISPDSIIKFRNLALNIMEIDSTIIFNPYYYFIEKTFHKKCTCEFSKIIFSKGNTYAIAGFLICCGPDNCRGETFLMKKTKNEWIVIDILVFDGS